MLLSFCGYKEISILSGLVTPTELPISSDRKEIENAYSAFVAELAHENRCRLDSFKTASAIDSCFCLATYA